MFTSVYYWAMIGFQGSILEKVKASKDNEFTWLELLSFLSVWLLLLLSESCFQMVQMTPPGLPLCAGLRESEHGGQPKQSNVQNPCKITARLTWKIYFISLKQNNCYLCIWLITWDKSNIFGQNSKKWWNALASEFI